MTTVNDNATPSPPHSEPWRAFLLGALALFAVAGIIGGVAVAIELAGVLAGLGIAASVATIGSVAVAVVRWLFRLACRR